MALITCKECGREVSDNAGACPGCGAPVRVAGRPEQVPPGATELVGGDNALTGAQRARDATPRRKWLLLAGGAAVLLIVFVAVAAAFLIRADPCVRTQECKEYGACSSTRRHDGELVLDGQGRRACAASSNAECRRSRICEQHGLCSMAPYTDRPGFGECHALSDEDCTSSWVCKSEGYCAAKQGRVCVSEAHPSAKALAVGNLALSDLSTCCVKREPRAKVEASASASALSPADTSPPPSAEAGVRPSGKRSPRVQLGEVSVDGRLNPEAVQRAVRKDMNRLQVCYETALRDDPNLEGRVSVRIVIGTDGSVSNVSNAGSDLSNQGVLGCVIRAFHGMQFPRPEGGIVKVTYPIVLSQSDK